MLNARLSTIQGWLPGSRLAGDDVQVRGVSSDSRRDCAGTLFVALVGPQHDGHDHLSAAVDAGAIAALVSREQRGELPHILCEDTAEGLHQMARGWLAQCPARRLALTGSNGKTTVKNLLAAMLSSIGSCHATAGNYNNEIGVPLTVLALSPGHQYAVFELGAGQPGDIAPLAELVAPEVSLVTNVGPTHLERMGSEHAVAETKAAIYAALSEDGTAVINADDAFADLFEARAGNARRLHFGIDAAHADLRASDLQQHAQSRFVLHLDGQSRKVVWSLPGRHNVLNALAAASCAWAVGVSLDAIVDALQQAIPTPGRYRELPQPGGWLLVDDSYNANPASLNAGISTLAARAGEAWLVLGDMGELGEQAESLHASCGRHARSRGVARLYAVGPLSRHAVDAFGSGGRHFGTQDELVAELKSDLSAGVNVLVKGSRSAAMERVVSALQQSGGSH